jgi:hypothetical protein
MRILNTLGAKVAELLLPKTEAAAGCAPSCYCKECAFGGSYCDPSGVVTGGNRCVIRCCLTGACKTTCTTL